MKKIRINLISADDGYDEVSGGTQYPKWKFSEPGMAVLECVIMDRKTLPQQKGGGTYDLYTVLQKDTKNPFVFFCGKVLEDKLKNIPIYSLVKIIFEGINPIKKYHLYKVMQNRNFKYDPAVYNIDDFAEVKSDGLQKIERSSDTTLTIAGQGQVEMKRPAVQQIEEDLPF